MASGGACHSACSINCASPSPVLSPEYRREQSSRRASILPDYADSRIDASIRASGAGMAIFAAATPALALPSWSSSMAHVSR
jgi:hypothetical protein